MKASVLDLRRRMSEVLRALEQNQPVTLLYRGKEKGVIYPRRQSRRAQVRVTEHSAFGMWQDRKDLQDVEQVVRDLRKVRSHAI